MSISAHIERSLERVLRSERESAQLFLIDGMPMAGKTTLVKSVFADLAYVDLNDLYPRNLAHTQPRDFFAVYGKRLVVDGIEKAPELIDYLPDENTSQIVLVGYLSLKDKEKLEEKGALIRTVMPISQREYASKAAEPLGLSPVALRITYPQPGFFDILRNGFLPRNDLSQSTSAFYENWLARFFAEHVRDVLHASKDTLFFNYMKVLALHNMQELNHSKFAKEAGISYATAIYWTQFLVDCGVILEINSMKLEQRRQVKRSKMTYTDTGLLAFLLGCATGEEVFAHPTYEGILSGFTAAEIIKNYAALGKTAPLFFYRDTAHKHVELALQTPQGWLPIAFLSRKTRPVKETIRHVDVLVKIGGMTQDIVFVSDGTLTVDSTSYPVLSATAL